MSLENRINEDLKNAMRAKDEAGLRALRAIKAGILLEKTSGKGTDMTEADETRMLQKMLKQRADSRDIFSTQNRPELAAKEEEEIAIISRYVPQQLSAEEVRATVERIIAQTGAGSMKDMGPVMAAANKALAGKADGKTISEVVKQLLIK